MEVSLDLLLDNHLTGIARFVLRGYDRAAWRDQVSKCERDVHRNTDNYCGHDCTSRMKGNIVSIGSAVSTAVAEAV
jgi:hypothetical protein